MGVVDQHQFQQRMTAAEALEYSVDLAQQVNTAEAEQDGTGSLSA